MKKVNVTIMVMFIIATLVLVTGCSGAKDSSSEVTKEVFAMDTYMTLTAYGDGAEEAVDKAIERINELDNLLSTGNEESEIYKLNDEGSGTLSDDASYLVRRALKLWNSTDGAFDMAIYPLMEAWGFTTGDYTVPDEQQIDDLLTLISCDDISFDEDSGEISFNKDGMKIDLGGIAKGYTSSEIMNIYKECGVESGLVSLGGNVQVLGKKTDGSDWNVGIEDPEDESQTLGVLKVADKAVITSGGYERYFEEDGKTYHHIIDPETGKPADSGVTSVTIVSDDGTLADGLSTSLFIMGKAKAIKYWKSHSEEFDTIIVTDDNKIYVTEGLEDSFSSDSDFTIVEK